MNTDKIADLLGRGLSQAVVASAVGVSESRISQLMDDAAFAERVAEKKLLHVTKDTERNDTIDNIKSTLLSQLEKSVAYAHKPGDVLIAARALQTLAGTRSGNETAGQQQVQSQVVQVVMPSFITQQFTRNSQNEIIDVGGRSMATLTPAALKTLSKQKQLEVPNGRQETQAAAVIPAATHREAAAEAA